MSSGKLIKSFDEDLNDDNDQSISYLVSSFYLFQYQYFFSHGTHGVSRSAEPGEVAGGLKPPPPNKIHKIIIHT